jgi:pilus assembly protein CpaB
MRRGGPILLILVLIIVVLIAVAFLVVQGIGPFARVEVSPTAPIEKIVIARQPINQDDEITEALLSTEDLPKNLVTEKMITDKQSLIGKFALSSIAQGWPLSLDMVTDRRTTGGKAILPGQVAISIAVKRIDMVGYAIKDGDYVDVLATNLFVDLDASFQSILPDSFGQVVNAGSPPDGAPLAVLGMSNGSGQRAAGRAELDPTLNQVIYFIPAEAQRPRLVSQMILQDIQVLHVGTFPLTGPISQGDVQATPQPAGGQPAATPVPLPEPDIITLVVSPQDAVSLTYLMYSGTKLTLVLRAPDDRSRAETEAATLQYILSQYAIPVPAKLPYGFEPRMNVLPVIGAAPTPSQ